MKEDHGLTQSNADNTRQIEASLRDNKIYQGDVMNKHFFRSYEAYLMLKMSSAVDESDIKNEDVIRMQQMSKSLMMSILTVNEKLVNCSDVIA